jgi:hypothetical protein
VQLTPPPAALAAFDQRLTAILMALRPLIAHHFLRHSWVPNAIAVPLWNRIGRYAARLSRLIALVAANTLPKPCRPRPRPMPAQPAERARKPHPPIPRHHGWMLAAMGWHVAGYRNQLETLLAAPEAAGFLAAAPNAGRLLRPICHMLGIDVPALRRPPRPRRQSCPRPRTIPRLEPTPEPAPEPAPGPPVRPFCPRLLARWPWAPRAEPPVPRASTGVLRRLAGPPMPLPLLG